MLQSWLVRVLLAWIPNRTTFKVDIRQTEVASRVLPRSFGIGLNSNNYVTHSPFLHCSLCLSTWVDLADHLVVLLSRVNQYYRIVS